jgi:hypothetical protein
MRILALAAASVLAVCLADPTLAATVKKKKVTYPNSDQTLRPDFDKCEAQSVQAGAPVGQSGHREFMMQCLYGVVTGRPGVS